MKVKGPKHGGIGEGYQLVGLGGTLAGAIILFMAAGWMLDRWLGLTPVLTLGGTALGSVLGFLNVYWKVQADVERHKARRSEQKNDR